MHSHLPQIWPPVLDSPYLLKPWCRKGSRLMVAAPRRMKRLLAFSGFHRDCFPRSCVDLVGRNHMLRLNHWGITLQPSHPPTPGVAGTSETGDPLERCPGGGRSQVGVREAQSLGRIPETLTVAMEFITMATLQDQLPAMEELRKQTLRCGRRGSAQHHCQRMLTPDGRIDPSNLLLPNRTSDEGGSGVVSGLRQAGSDSGCSSLHKSELSSAPGAQHSLSAQARVDISTQLCDGHSPCGS